MKRLTLKDYQNLPVSSVYLTTIVEKLPKGKIPSMTICPVVMLGKDCIRLDCEKPIDLSRFFQANMRPISDYYPEGQYRFCMKKGHVCLEFSDSEPYDRYVEYAGRSFDNGVVKFACR